MKIVITGATGNVGTSTLRALGADPQVREVIGIARRRPAVDLPKVRFVEADVTSDDLISHFRGAHAVIHLAWLIQPARDPERLERVNIQGSQRVFEAAIDAGVPGIVHASSLGAYSPGPKDRRVDEQWPTQGIATSLYSRHKVEVERMLDRFERHFDSVRFVRMRPALVFKRGAAAEIRRLFIGPFVPRFLFHEKMIPFVPDVERLRFQCVHSHDVGRAFALAATSDIHGPVNVAAEPIIDPGVLSEVLHARRMRLSSSTLRRGVQAAWRMHLTPTHRGWVDLALEAPLMDTTRARMELGWQPRHTATEALLELLDGLHRNIGMPTAPLHP